MTTLSGAMRPTRKDGIKTLADLKDRCRIDAETGCWPWAGGKQGRSPRVWIPGLGAQSITFALQWLAHGTRPESGRMLIPACRNIDCANIAHRTWGTRSELFSILRPVLQIGHKVRIGAAKRRVSAIYSPEVHLEIMGSKEPAKALGLRLGIHPTHIARIRRGDRWAVTPNASSVFSWRPGA